jgi:general secretion pathway protein D
LNGPALNTSGLNSRGLNSWGLNSWGLNYSQGLNTGALNTGSLNSCVMNACAKKPLALISLALMLAACASTDSNSSGQTAARAAGSPSAQMQAASTAASSSATQLQRDVSQEQQALEEQQALLDEINRDGSAVALSGYRETAPVPVQVEGDDVVQLNYEQAELRRVLEELADALDISIIIDPTIADTVSIRTDAERPLRRADIWPLIRLLTQEAGVSLERIGNIYYARKADSNLPQEISSAGQIGDGTAGTVMQITPLIHISVASALELLTPLVEPAGTVIRISNNNTLAITANREQLSRINELLKIVDADPFRNQGIQLYPLKNANATDVATELTDILSMIEGNSPAYQVKGLERINSLLVTAPASRGFTEIARWIRILDADRQEQAEQLFHYRVKNLSAITLAETLTNVFRLDEAETARLENVALRNRSDGASSQETQQITETFIGPDGEPIVRTQTTPIGGGAGAVPSMAVSADLKVSIVADEATNSLLIRSNPRDYRQLLTTINQLDAVPLQVMINAVIAQITLTNDTRFGVDWSRIANSTAVSTEFLPQPAGALGGLLFTRSFLDGAARVEATLEAIAVNNEVRLLARPSLTVINNQEGLIQIGSEVPVQSGQETTVGGTTIRNISYRPTGIELTITPRINDDGVVNLTIAQALSSVDADTGIDGNPIFQNQEISTTVVVRNGENVVLGGLIQSDNGDLNTGVPGLNRVPILGRLFSYQQNLDVRKELFIVLRPEIVNLNDRDGAQYREILRRFEMVAEIIDEPVL